jgi:beta-fructofuranosidase
VTLPVSLDEECAVFTIGAPDTVAPSAPAGLRRATSDTLAWAEGRDDVGVAGYLVYRDGVEVASVPSAVYVPGGDLTSAEWTVAAVDSAGNVGPRSAPAV